MSTYELFKTVIFKTKLNQNINKLIKFSNEIKKQKGRELSNVGGYQSNNLDEKNIALKSLIKEVSKNVNLFSKETLRIPQDLHLDSSWLNINGFKDFNNLHTHPFSIVSGVFYIKTPVNCGSITFHTAAPIKCYVNDNILEEYNNYNCSKYFFPVEENGLYLFPSWLDHSVSPNLSNEERISYAFNFS